MGAEPRRALERIKPYVPGLSLEALKEAKGIAEAVKLASNENPLGAGRLAREAARRAAAELHLYPDGDSAALRKRLARELDVGPENIALGCGSDELIRMLAEAYLDPGDAAVFADVTFSQYAFAARLMDACEVAVPLAPGDVHDLPAMAGAARKHRARLVFVCNPNNPTGTYVGREAVAAFLDALPEETLAVFDEAYFEYVTAGDFPDTVAEVRKGRNVVVLRTFSKIHGLAGLRVGYAVAPPAVVQALDRVRPPFNVNRVAQAAALAALDDREHVEASRRMNTSERARLAREFEAMGLTVRPSEANFLFVDLGRPADRVYEALLEMGVIVRKGSSFGRPTALRITVGTPEQNDRLLAALRRAFPVEVAERREAR